MENGLQLSLDWLSWTIRPPRDMYITTSELLSEIISLMHLQDVWKRTVMVGRNKYYANIYRIDDISFKVCSDDRLFEQGIMVEFTSNGLAIYQSKLADLNITVFDVMRDCRSLVAGGFYVNSPRIDIALDDICRAGEKPFLDMSKIYDKWANHEFCSRARGVDRSESLDFKSDDTLYIKKGKVCDKRVKGRVGRTVYFGCRKSSVCVRFYDKLTEQLQKFKDVPEDITHWVRCEYEFHADRANAIISMLIDNDFDEFKKLFSRYILGHLRFIEPKDSNRSRCPTSRWWLRFLRNIEGDTFKLRTVPKQAVKADKTVRWLRKSCFPTIYAYIATVGAEEFINEAYNVGKKNLNFNQLQFISDMINADIDDTIDGSLLPAICWGWLSVKGFEETLKQIDKDFKAVQFCKEYGSRLDGKIEDILKMALRLAA